MRNSRRFLSAFIESKLRYFIAQVLLALVFLPAYLASLAGIFYIAHEIIFLSLCAYRIYLALGVLHFAAFVLAIFFARPFYYILEASIDTDVISLEVGAALMIVMTGAYLMAFVYALSSFIVSMQSGNGQTNAD